ncbi:50S ribosomal protein L1p (L10Ae) [Candidatus Nasuia deltocephalinicola]|nr:50S ribosomal protein L1p (L10Ae) [Candidatus Nasuia deltocephalinicola]
MLTRKRKFILNLKKKYKKISLNNSLILLKKYSIFKFNESIDLSVKLSSDFLKLNKILSGSLNFPYNFIKSSNILIFVDGYLEFLLRKNGYFNVGLFTLKSFFLKKKNDFKYFVTTYKFINYIEIFNEILFKKKITPLITNDKDILFFLSNIDFSYNFKSDKYGIINLSIGKVNYSLDFLEKNFYFFLNFLKNKKKDLMIYKFILNNIYISTTMGISYNIFFDKYFLF